MTNGTAYLIRTKTSTALIFYKDNWNIDFIIRNTHRTTETTEDNKSPIPATTAIILYIRCTSEAIVRILQPYNFRVAMKITTLRHLLITVKERDELNERQGTNTRPPVSEFCSLDNDSRGAVDK